MTALYRPGPMKNINHYIDRSHGKEEVQSIHPLLNEVLKETHGIIVYQEQVMEIAARVAGFTLAEADEMRKAVGKKISSLMDELSEKFINGAVKNGIPKLKARQIFELIEKFAQYGFNKSHATASVSYTHLTLPTICSV